MQQPLPCQSMCTVGTNQHYCWSSAQTWSRTQTHLELHSTSKECTALHGADELHIARLAAVVGKRKIIRRVLRKA